MEKELSETSPPFLCATVHFLPNIPFLIATVAYKQMFSKEKKDIPHLQ